MKASSIAIITATFPPYRGGMGKIAEMDARQLASLGFDVHVYTPAAGADGQRGGETDSYRVHHLTSFGRFGNAAFVPGVSGLLKKYPLVLLHYPFFGGAEPLALAKRLRAKGGKLLITYHMDVVGSGLLRPFFAAHTRWIAPSILHQADRLLVTSFDYARNGNLSGLFVDESERFRELAPSVDTVRFSPGPKPPELLARYKLAADDRIILFVGGLDRAHYFKGVPRLLEAMTVRELAAAKAVIVGGGDLRPMYEQTAIDLGLQSRVVFAGGVSEEELPLYYRLGDVFAFPSVDGSEAFGIAALEAMSAGVPVIASDLPGVRTIVREGTTGFRVFPGSAAALAGALAKLLGDEALRARFGEAGRAMAESEYGDEARLKKWTSIINDL